jgi:hypothetical protein
LPPVDADSIIETLHRGGPLRTGGEMKARIFGVALAVANLATLIAITGAGRKPL